MRKVCVITGSRAEYGLLFWTLKAIQNDPQLTLQLCVTGMHLSPEFGLTYKNIENDGFVIDEKVEMLMSSDTPVGVSKSIGLGIISIAEALDRMKPDIILLLGDRFEALSAAIAATINRIPIAHCHGGETTEGVIDESIRHSITKMSHIHFTSTEEYKKRVIQLGEIPSNVYNVGALGIENINKLQLLSKPDLEKSLDFEFGKYTFIITYHPITLEHNTAKEQFISLLNALDRFQEAKLIFTKPNADTDGRIIISLIDSYVKNNPNRAISFNSLGQLRYLSALKFVDLVIGNSSSGLIEAPSFKKPTINIGDRQKGRISGGTVLNCNPDTESIDGAIKNALGKAFQDGLKNHSNPYGEANSSEKIIDVLRTTNLSDLLKKSFYDL